MQSEIKKNITFALLAQIVSLMASVLMSLFVPKILNIYDYALWQLFLFYNSYVGLFLFGLNGGIYLTEGGKRGSDIDYSAIGSQIRFGALVQIIIGICIFVAVNLINQNPDRVFVLCAASIYLIISNVNDLFGYFYQAINQTRLYSISATVDRALFLAVLAISVTAFRVDDYKVYIVAFIATKSVALALTLGFGREIICSKWTNVRLTILNVIHSIQIGLKLTISTLAGTLILGVTRQLVDLSMGIEVFGKVSFSVSMVNFFLQFSAQFALVLFPELRRKGDNLPNIYKRSSSLLSTVLPVVYILYIPLSVLINAWLPQYQDSLKYLILLLPMCIYDGKMNVLGTTYYKVVRKEGTLLKVNLVSLGASIVLNFLACFVFRSLTLSLTFTTFVIMARSIYSEKYFENYFSCSDGESWIWNIALSLIFMLSYDLGKIMMLPLVLIYGFFLYRNRSAISRFQQR